MPKKEKQGKKRVSLSLDIRVHDFIKRKAQEENRSASSYVNNLVTVLIEQKVKGLKYL